MKKFSLHIAFDAICVCCNDNTFGDNDDDKQWFQKSFSERADNNCDLLSRVEMIRPTPEFLIITIFSPWLWENSYFPY